MTNNVVFIFVNYCESRNVGSNFIFDNTLVKSETTWSTLTLVYCLASPIRSNILKVHRSSCRKVFCKINVLKIFATFTGKHLCGSYRYDVAAKNTSEHLWSTASKVDQRQNRLTCWMCRKLIIKTLEVTLFDFFLLTLHIKYISRVCVVVVDIHNLFVFITLSNICDGVFCEKTAKDTV